MRRPELAGCLGGHPGIEFVPFHHPHDEAHEGVVRAAELGALRAVVARDPWGHRERVHAAGNQVELVEEVLHVERVDHVVRDQDEFHLFVHREVEDWSYLVVGGIDGLERPDDVDAVLWVRVRVRVRPQVGHAVGELPGELEARDLDRECVFLSGVVDVHEGDHRDREEGNHDEDRHAHHRDFDLPPSVELRRKLIALAPVTDHRVDERRSHEHEHDQTRDRHDPEEVVHLACFVGDAAGLDRRGRGRRHQSQERCCDGRGDQAQAAGKRHAEHLASSSPHPCVFRCTKAPGRALRGGL